MRFVRMQVTGFKSFVEPTEVEFLSGLTGLVGPNGCGKSNLVEALRWAMGETSARQVRSGEMDDVIFFGTGSRPPHNIAEVILALDNSDRRAPTQFNQSDELNVARRIERGRGSSYRVNGAEVRQRDVVTLFADASTGARSSALVSQGRIGAIISAKPVERRTLLEEAAGISGLYSRRHEAEIRLRAAQTNLARLDDVVSALQAQYQALKRQARQAARYRKLTEQIRRQEAIVLHLMWSEAGRRHAEALAAHRAIDQEVIELTRSAAAATTAMTELESAMPALKERHAQAAAEFQSLITAVRVLEGEERRIETQQRDVERQITQIKVDSERQREFCDNARQHARRLDNEQADLEAALARAAQDLERADTGLSRARIAAAASERSLEKLASAASAAETRAHTLKRQLLDFGARRHKSEKRLAELKANLERARCEDEHGPELQGARADAERLERDRNTARSGLLEAEEMTAQARRNEDDKRKAHDRAATDAAKLRSETTALSDLLKPPNSDRWPPVVDVIEADAGYEVALGAALGDDLDAPLDSESPVHWRMLPEQRPAQPLPSPARPLTTQVRGPAALHRRLSQIGLIDDDRDGPLLCGRLAQGQRLVSKSGALWRWDGFTVAAGTPTPAARRLEQRNRLATLRRDLEAADAREGEARSRRAKSEKAVEHALEAESRARTALREADRLLESARDRASKLSEAAAAAQSRAAGLVEMETQLAADLAELENQEAAAEKELANLPHVAELQASVDRQRVKVDEDREALESIRSHHVRLEHEINSRKQRISAIRSERDSWERQIRSATAQQESLESRQKKAESDLADIMVRPDEIRRKRSELMDRQETARLKRSAANDDVVEAETRLGEAGRSLRELEGLLSDARVERERKQTDVALHSQEMSRVAETAGNRLQTTPDSLLTSVGIDPDDGLPSREEAEDRLERLRGEQHRLGEVNLRVEEEVVALDEQIRGLCNERDDLLAAVAKLRQGISGLNREGRARLLDAFEQAERHFVELFHGLFGGGKAELQLTDSEDPLEAGLEVFACPPGKRMQSLSLMSGGEQALTALALLFTVFLINPAPVCVLDEVDAPLDSDNVNRFCDLLEELSNRLSTRFFIVTHNSQTMARMNHLYGVTMPEPGVSQLVSVDLQTADRLAATA